MPFAHAGELAALGVSFCWVATALALEAAGRRVGSIAVNLIRLLMAVALLGLYTGFDRGRFLPTDATNHAWFWLSVSGLVGLCVGDLCLFRAFLVIGSRLSLLVMSLVPPITALFGWVVMGEVLGGKHWMGMAMTVVGVAWVVYASRREPSSSSPNFSGFALAFAGAVGQSMGLVLSKYGMGGYDAVASTQIRVIAGLAGFALLLTVIGWWPRVLSALRDRTAMASTAVGSFFGPFVGVSLSLAAVKYTQAGVAATLMALPPVLIIPVSVWCHKERVTWQSMAGSSLAVAGAAVLFL